MNMGGMNLIHQRESKDIKKLKLLNKNFHTVHIIQQWTV